MRKKKDNPLNILIDLAKDKIDAALNNFAELEACLESLKKENLITEQRIKKAAEQVKQEKLAVGKLIKETAAQDQQTSEPVLINQQQYFVLPNIDNKIEEAVADAIIFFKKMCPYCDTSLYGGISEIK